LNNPGNLPYWFTIDTYVHITVKRNWILLYNSLTGQTLEFFNAPKITKLVKRLLSPGNLMVIPLSEEELSDPDISGFVTGISENFMGDLIETRFSKQRPIQVMPVVKIDKDVKYLKRGHRSVGESLKLNLTGLTLFLNAECKMDCPMCSQAFRQTNCCTASQNRGQEIDIEKLRGFFAEMKNCNIMNLNILGGDIFSYSRLAELLGMLHKFSAPTYFYLHYLNAHLHFPELETISRYKSDRYFLKLLVSFPVQKELLAPVLKRVLGEGFKTTVIFIVKSEEEFNAAESIAAMYSIPEPLFQPYFDGSNRELFEKDLAIAREEITGAKPSLTDIYARQKMNPRDFGRLIIRNDGRIYANVNRSSTGILGSDSLYDVIYREMIQGKSWRRTRNNVMPCKKCVFNLLCPPLSNLEIILGRNNLCNIEIVS